MVRKVPRRSDTEEKVNKNSNFSKGNATTELWRVLFLDMVWVKQGSLHRAKKITCTGPGLDTIQFSHKLPTAAKSALDFLNV